MIWTRRTVALTALGTVLGFGMLGGGAAYAMTSGHSAAAAVPGSGSAPGPGHRHLRQLRG